VNFLGGYTVGHSKHTSVYVCVLFRMVSKIELFHCTVAKLLIKRYYILFLISVFIVQVTKLVQFTQYNTYAKIPLSTSLHCNSCEDMTCCSAECILTFLYAGDIIHYEIEQFVSCICFCSVNFTLLPTP
jgi:hypothetical protein